MRRNDNMASYIAGEMSRVMASDSHNALFKKASIAKYAQETGGMPEDYAAVKERIVKFLSGPDMDSTVFHLILKDLDRNGKEGVFAGKELANWSDTDVKTLVMDLTNYHSAEGQDSNHACDSDETSMVMDAVASLNRASEMLDNLDLEKSATMALQALAMVSKELLVVTGAKKKSEKEDKKDDKKSDKKDEKSKKEDKDAKKENPFAKKDKKDKEEKEDKKGAKDKKEDKKSDKKDKKDDKKDKEVKKKAQEVVLPELPEGSHLDVELSGTFNEKEMEELRSFLGDFLGSDSKEEDKSSADDDSSPEIDIMNKMYPVDPSSKEEDKDSSSEDEQDQKKLNHTF